MESLHVHQSKYFILEMHLRIQFNSNMFQNITQLFLLKIIIFFGGGELRECVSKIDLFRTNFFFAVRFYNISLISIKTFKFLENF